jgi:hypothetical protein
LKEKGSVLIALTPAIIEASLETFSARHCDWRCSAFLFVFVFERHIERAVHPIANRIPLNGALDSHLWR